MQTSQTGKEGSYTFNGLPPGRYTLTVMHDGYKLKHIPAIEIQNTKTVPIVSHLQPFSHQFKKAS